MARIYKIEYRETTFGIRGGMITNDMKVETSDIQKVLDTIKVACIGPSLKDEIVIHIREEIPSSGSGGSPHD